MKLTKAHSLAIFAALLPSIADAQIRDLPGFKQKIVERNDDGSAPVELLGWTANFFGKQRNAVYVNNNGNITFDSPLPTYTPFGLTGVNREIIAAFFADVDTRNILSNVVTYGSDTIDGRRAFGVNYIDVGYYSQHVDKLNSFQLVIIQRADTGEGNFDIEFNYQRIQWETGDASNGTNGLGGVSASVGWSNGSGLPGTSFELPGSLIPGSFLDNGGFSLVRSRTIGSSTQIGRWVFRARGGIVIPSLTIDTGCPIPNATLSRLYTHRFDAFGSKPPYRWSVVPDPDSALSVSMNASGLLTASPNQVGQYNFTVRVTSTDEDGDVTVSRRCSLTVDPQSTTILTNSALPATTTGSRYQTTLRADGPGPFQFSLFNSAPIPGLTLNSNGTLSGVIAAPGVYQMQVQARSDQGVPAIKRFTVNVTPSELSIRGTCPIPNGTGGVPFRHQFEASGGVPPYRWSFVGNPPTGLFFNEEGRLSGIPTVPHWWPFEVTVSDDRGATKSLGCGVVVLFPETRIASSCPLPSARAGASYSRRLEAAGGTGPYTWSVSGTLPPGLELNRDGTLSGTPSSAGAFPFRLQAADSRGQVTASACTITVDRGEYGIATCPLPSAYAGEPYSTQISATGGVEPYTFGSAAPLPGGMRISPAGFLTGLLAIPGIVPIDLRATDETGRTTTRSCNLTVLPQALRPTDACPLPAGALGQTYAFQLGAAGGIGPYAFNVRGILPPGLQISERGTITGSPTQAGFFPLGITLRDRTGANTTSDCSVFVDIPEPPTFSITGLPDTLTPASAGPRVTVQLSRAYSLPIDAEATLVVTADTNSSVGAVNRPDPVVRFSNGQQKIPISFAPGVRTATLQLSGTGTVASIITINIGSVTVNGSDVGRQASATARVNRSIPVVTSVCYAPTSEGFDIDVSGYSTTRDLTTAQLTFGANTYIVDMLNSSVEYFANDESVRTGGTFRVRAPYRLTKATVQSLGQGNVVIRNSAGSSPSRSIARCQ